MGHEDGGVGAGGWIGGVKPLLLAHWMRGLAPGCRPGRSRVRRWRGRSSNDGDFQATPRQ
jgi:hypothetical protein